MTREGRRLPLLLGLFMAYGLFVAECRYHQRDDDAAMTEARHRHRHRHESSNRRNHHELEIGRSSWQKVDYEYDGEDGPIDEDDYEVQPYIPDHPRSSRYRFAQRGYNYGRMFEPRYSPRYHPDDGHRGNWYDDDNDGRRIPSRYNAKNYAKYNPGRNYHRSPYSRNRDVSDFKDVSKDDYDYERLPHRYPVESDETDKHHERWRNSRRHASLRKDTRGRMNGWNHGTKRHHLEDRNRGVIDRDDSPARWTDEWKVKSNTSETSKYHFSKDKDKKIEDEDEDYEDRGGLEEDDKDEEEDDIWKIIDDEDNEEDNEQEDLEDNDFYESKTKSPLKTYEDIIRRLTFDEPTTTKTTIKRDYRNIESNKYTKRDGYKSLNEPRNVSKPVDLLRFANAHRTTTNYLANKRTAVSSTVKSVGSIGHKLSKNATEVATIRGNDRRERKIAVSTKTKSLEQDYEYLNVPDNEKDDLVKAGADDDSAMQADNVNNNDYTDGDDGDENETPVNTLATSTTTTIKIPARTTTTTTTTSTTTTTTTTTTPKPSIINQHYDYRDQRAYDSGTGSQYNGYQAKNDYPPMSAHSVHKWQTLGTREGVKETRNNMQQYNKNGAEMREAIQHAMQVNREGSCQWPRARVIPVRDVYPSPSTTYVPHCAILHRCSDDTGCCRSEALTCVPKHSHRVELFFYTANVAGSTVVEKLSFYNHTECECRERSKYDTTNEKFADQRVYRHSSSAPQNIKKPPSRKPCRCPSEFTPRITPEGACQCNCYDSNQNCIKTRRGKGYFSLADRICIQNNECAQPNCEFGEYMKRPGKCPGKRDTFNAMAGYRTNLNHRFRS